MRALEGSRRASEEEDRRRVSREVLSRLTDGELASYERALLAHQAGEEPSSEEEAIVRRVRQLEEEATRWA